MSATVLLRPYRLALAPTTAVVAGATLIGLALRLAAATGDLGLDEVWSLKLVEGVNGLGAVFWGLSHDNNHLLNSAWLFLLGPGAPVWADRLPAVLLGTLTVPALARLCGRRNPAAGALAAVFDAVALPLVDFGSEARGYAGLALAAVLAFDCGGRALAAAEAGDGSARRREAWRLGAAAGFGLLCHLTMASAMAAVGLAMLIRAEAYRRPRAATCLVVPLLLPSALMSLPAFGFLVAGLAVRGRFMIGDVDPFTPGKLVEGFGGMASLTAGLPETLPPALALTATLALLAVAARHRLASPWTLALAAAALVAMPLAAAALRLPNVAYPRYFAIPALALLALLAETLAALLKKDESRRAAVAAAAAMISGSLLLDAFEIRDGRGGTSGTLSLMRTEGSPAYTADRPFMAALLLDEAARRGGVPAPTPIPAEDACRQPPDWFVAVGVVDDRPDGAVTVGPPPCATRYGVRRAFPASPLSGTRWTLYRRG